MTQAKELLGAIKPESELEFLIEGDGGPKFEDLENTSDEDTDEDESSAKATKGKTTRRSQAKKKHFTEDSIRLYLQEIGRIRLLRAEEEIELARKIADLLELERIREDIMESLQREPSDLECPC
jgi:RNA polymerase primary sigma factor